MTDSKFFFSFSLFCRLFSVKQTIQIHRPRAHNILHRHSITDKFTNNIQTKQEKNNKHKFMVFSVLKIKFNEIQYKFKEKKT